jgi:hypothetical protein
MGLVPIHLAIAGHFTDNSFGSFLIGTRISDLLTSIWRINKNVVILQVDGGAQICGQLYIMMYVSVTMENQIVSTSVMSSSLT